MHTRRIRYLGNDDGGQRLGVAQCQVKLVVWHKELINFLCHTSWHNTKQRDQCVSTLTNSLFKGA